MRLHKSSQVRVFAHQRSDRHVRQPRIQRSVKVAKNRSWIADGCAKHRSDDIQFRCVACPQLGGPAGGKAAARIAPQRDRRRARNLGRLEILCGPNTIKHAISGFAWRYPASPRTPMIRNKHPPAPTQRTGHGNVLPSRRASKHFGQLGVVSQNVGREPGRGNGIDGALIGHHGGLWAEFHPCRPDDRSERSLGCSVQIGCPVKQLIRDHRLRDDTQESQTDLAGPQHCARGARLEALGRSAETIVAGR